MEKATLIKIGTHIAAGAFGALVCGAIVYKRTTKRYYNDVESVRAYYRSRKIVDVPKVEEKEPVVEKKISNGSESIQQEFVSARPIGTEFIDYRKFSKDISDETSQVTIDHVNTESPYQIGPGEFGDLEGYEEKNYTYFSNGVVTDETFTVIDQPEDILGDYKSLLAESEYLEPIYIRNPITMVDYCISPVDKEYYLG